MESIVSACSLSCCCHARSVSSGIAESVRDDGSVHTDGSAAAAASEEVEAEEHADDSSELATEAAADMAEDALGRAETPDTVVSTAVGE